MRSMAPWMVSWSRLQNLEALRQARLGGAEQREELVVLDLVMAVEVRQEHLQARREAGAEALRRHQAFAELARRSPSALPPIAAEAVVDVEPEARQLAEIDVIRPDLARIALEEDAEIVRPAGAGFDVEHCEACRLAWGSYKARSLPAS